MLLNYPNQVDCASPIVVKDKIGNYRYVSCGRCELCKMHHKREWSLRLMLESLSSDYSMFITLTFKNIEIAFYSLLQKMFKSWRKLGYIFKYFCVREYGDLYGRLHFHLLVFGLEYKVCKQLLSDYWNYGFYTLSPANDKRVFYTCGYCMKKDGITKAYMSKGIGKQYLLDNISEIKSNGFISVNGFRYSLPRYFVHYLRSVDPNWYFDFVRKNSNFSLDDLDYDLSAKKLKNETIKHKNNIKKGGIL